MVSIFNTVCIFNCISNIVIISVYALEIEDNVGRVGNVLVLLLTLIFIDMSRTTSVRFLAKYYYTSFLFLSAVAIQNASGDLFSNRDEWILRDSNNF